MEIALYICERKRPGKEVNINKFSNYGEILKINCWYQLLLKTFNIRKSMVFENSQKNHSITCRNYIFDKMKYIILLKSYR